MTIEVLHERGQPARASARQLGVTEGTVRYRLRRRGRRVNLAELHEHLVAEYAYDGSVRFLQRYVRATYPPCCGWTTSGRRSASSIFIFRSSSRRSRSLANVPELICHLCP